MHKISIQLMSGAYKGYLLKTVVSIIRSKIIIKGVGSLVRTLF